MANWVNNGIKWLAGIIALAAIILPLAANAARTSIDWVNLSGTTYIQPNYPSGMDLLINGTSHYINFNTVTGSSGYGFRDSSGTMQFKNSGGSWTAFGSASLSGGTPGMLTSWVDASTLTATGTPTFAAFTSTSTATSTMAGGLKINGGGATIATIISCNTTSALTTDSSGNIVCGTVSGSGGITALGSGYASTTGTTITHSTSTLVFQGLTFGQTIIPSAGALLFTPTVSGTLNTAAIAGSRTLGNIWFDGTNLVSTTSAFTVGSIVATTTATSTFAGSLTVTGTGGSSYPQVQIGTTSPSSGHITGNLFEITGQRDGFISGEISNNSDTPCSQSSIVLGNSGTTLTNGFTALGHTSVHFVGGPGAGCAIGGPLPPDSTFINDDNGSMVFILSTTTPGSVTNNGYFQWVVNGAGAAAFAPMTLNNQGKLGIGTTSPYSMLSVAGTVVGQNYIATSTSATSTFAAAITVGAGQGTSTFGGGISMTRYLTTASSTEAGLDITSGGLQINTIGAALLLSDSAGRVGAYGGASACSANNFVTTISATGGSTCGTASISGVSLGGTLGALSHDTTFSGTSYTGTAAVSDWGLNLGTANTWTANITAPFFNATQYGGYQQNGALLGYASTTNQNTIWGISSGGTNSTTSATVNGSTAIGYSSLGLLTTGVGNTGVGAFSLNIASTSPGNTAVGYGALMGSTTNGSNKTFSATGQNTAVGWYSLASTTSGNSNTAIGYKTGRSLTTGTNDVFIGNTSGASSNLSSASSVTCVGDNSCQNLSTGGSNTAVGSSAGDIFTSGSDNTAIGYRTLSQGTGAGQINDTALGSQAGNVVIAGANDDTFLGFKSGTAATSGNGDTFLGSLSGQTLTTGQNDILIGYNAATPAVSTNNFLNIGNLIFGTLAASSSQTAAIANGGLIGISTTTPGATLSVAGTSTQTVIPLFLVSTSTASATSTAFIIDNAGRVGIGTNTPASTFQLSIQGAEYISGPATSTNAGGLKITGGGATISTLTSCNGTSALTTDSSGDIACGAITGVAGITALGSGFATTTGATITFSTTTLSFNGLTVGQTIVPSAGALMFTPTITGTLSNSGLANSTISGVALGGTLAALTATNATLTFSGSYTGTAAQTVGLNLGNANTWTALQQFNANASTSQLSVGSTAYFGGTATSTFTTAGALGLATTSPAALLGVAGNAFLDSTLISIGSSTKSTQINYLGNSTSTLPINTANAYTFATSTTGTPLLSLSTAAATNFGVIGIGTTTPGTGVLLTISNAISAVGGILINTWTNVTNAFTIKGSDGTTRFNVDTTATVNHLGIATSTPWATASFIGDGTNPILAIATTTNNGLPNFEINAVGMPMYSGAAATCDANCTFIAGNNARMRIRLGTSKTTATVTFFGSNPFGSIAPICVANEGDAGTVDIGASSTPSTVVLTALSALTSKDVDIQCDGIQ